jgi:hypothetical protein
MVFPVIFDGTPSFQSLILHGKQLEVQMVGLVIKRDDKMVFAMGCHNGKGTT